MRLPTDRSRLALLAALMAFSFWAVYTSYVTIHYFDLATNLTFRDLSQLWSDKTLAGTQAFPYQWRMLAFVLVRGVQSATGLDPHLIDLAIKTVALSGSAWLLYAFAGPLVSPMGAVLVTVMYLLVTAAAFASEGYSIYFTNDYLAIVCWFGGVVAVRHRAWAWAAIATFVGAWAKETTLLIVLLMAFEVWRRRAPLGALLVCAAAFAVPNLVLRSVYPAPLQQWAWWHMIMTNVPFLAREWPAAIKSLLDNLKVLLFLNVAWVWAYRAWRRRADPLLPSLALTLACYVALAWTVVVIRELRHMLPFTILVLPLAVAELESRLGAASSKAGRS